MKNFDDKWRQLTMAAQRAPVEEEAAAPFGFATRIAARAMRDEQPAMIAMFSRFSVRALYVACLLTLVSVAANYLAFAGTEDDEQALIDPVSEVLTNAS
jgi:hypothetical protein